MRDHLRFSQFGKASGWIAIEGRRVDFSDWLACRDHSWGVRPGVGGFEPFTGTLKKEQGWLEIYIWWLTETEGGLFQLQEDGDGKRLYLGAWVYRGGGYADSSTAQRGDPAELVKLSTTQADEMQL